MRRAWVLLAVLSVSGVAVGEDGPGNPTGPAPLDALLGDLEQHRRPAGWVGSGTRVPQGAEEAEARRALSEATLRMLAAREGGARAEQRARHQELAAARDHLYRMTLATIAAGAAAEPAPPSVEDVRRALRPDEALVLWGRDEDRAVALVVTPSGARRVDLGDRIDVEDRAVALRERLAAPDADAHAAAFAAARGLAVGRLGLDASVRTVLVGLDGALANLPAALLFPDHAVAVLPCLSLLRGGRAGRAPRGEAVLAVGDPAFRPLFGSPVPLPGAAREARGTGSVTLVGADATRSAVLAALASRPRWRALHFAGRVEGDAERPLLTAFGLATTATDDGRWTAREIAQERLEADLVVLSTCLACGTACVPDGSVTALPCAFLAAGVPSVVGFVGTLDDEAAAAFAVGLYRALAAGEPSAVAVRRAQEAVRGQPRWTHPRFWAGWTLWGLPD